MLRKSCVLLLLLSHLLDEVNCSENSYCSLTCQEGRKNYKHTVCERQNRKCGADLKCGPDFKSIELTDSLRLEILHMHNKFRNNVASGNETRGRQPTASNMNILAWNMELEFIAKCWANTCNGNPLKHDKCRKTRQYDVGQNLAFFNSSSATYFDLRSIVKTMITYWYNEVAQFKGEWVRNTQHRGCVVGHYTQLVWADTKEIGCGITYYTEIDRRTKNKWHLWVLACNYGPTGNYIGSPVYRIGSCCKSCGNSKSCNKQYTSLCGRNVDSNEIHKSFNPIYKI